MIIFLENEYIIVNIKENISINKIVCKNKEILPENNDFRLKIRFA